MSKVNRLLLRLAVLAALLAPALSVTAAPAPPAPPTLGAGAMRHAEFAPGGPDRLSRVRTSDAARQAFAAASPDAAAGAADGWSRVAFQSYQQGNWDIYAMRPDGAELMRLTKDAGVDARPQQSFADGAIAFISNRGGNFDIFAMAADGSNFRQVTADPAEDNYPSWSPDGRRLAFASNRGGSWDIYTVNPDGSGLAVFAGGPADDFGPAWSPDGKVIAWIRVSGRGVGRIWAANADGSNARELTTDQVFIENLTWSPDGKRIGFDADGTGDYFTDIAYIGYAPDLSLPTYPGFHTVQAPPMTDAVMGSFTMDGDILFSLVEYVVVGEELWIQDAALARMPRDEWHSVPRLLPQAGLDMNGNWQRADFTPPASALARPPMLASSMTGITLAWSGRDAGGSGLARYELQYSDNGGDWTYHFLPDPTATSIPFVSSTGDTTAFRVRAIDAAGNAERWVASRAGEGQTTFYRERYAGRLFDNRRTGIPGVQILGATRPDIPFISAASGAYEAYTFDAFYYLRAAHPAYGALPDVNPPGWSVSERVDISLPPKKNAVQNGGFEQSGQGWAAVGSSGGDYPYGSGHSGNYAARLGSGYPAGTVGIRQQITVPARAEKPTLALFARAHSDPAGLERLKVTLKPEGGPETAVALRWSDGPIWRHAWADLDAWAGQTAVLTIALQTAGGSAVPTVDIDEVSVGGWHTPAIAHVTALAELPGTVTIEGSNFEAGAAVAIDGTACETTYVNSETLTATVPAGVKPGPRAVWVTNPGGQQAQGSVRIGKAQFLPVMGFGE